MDKFQKSFTLEIEKEESDKYLIKGIASSYGNADSYDDIFMDGSLDSMIGKTVPLKVDHDRTVDGMIGKATISRDGDKIIFSGELLKGDPLAEKIALLKEMKVPLNVSIGGNIKKSGVITKNSKRFRGIEEAIIREISVVTTGANPKAKIIKSENGDDEMEKQMQEILEKMNAIEKTLADKTGEENVKMLAELGEIKKTLESNKGTEEINTKLTEIEKTLEKFDTIIKKSSEKNVSVTPTEEFNKSLRNKIVKKAPHEFPESFVKAATAAADVAAIIELDIDNDIVKVLGEQSPFFGLANKVAFKGEAFQVPVRTKKANSVEEVNLGAGTTNKSGVAYTFLTLYKGVLQSEFPISDELVMDTKLDLKKEINEVTTEDFAESIAERILRGVLNTTTYQGNKFQGIETVTTFMTSRTTEQLVADAYDYDELVDLPFKLQIGKRKNAAYFVSSGAALAMAKMKDNTGFPLWRESLIEGAPARFNGYPVYEVWNMGLEEGQLDILFADFSKFYKIGYDYTMRMEPDRDASTRTTNMVTSTRMGGIIRDQLAGWGITKKVVTP